MNASVLAGVTVVAASSAVCGAGLLLRRSARLTGALLVVAAALLLVPVVADVVAAGVWLLAAVAVATAAFVVYPAPSLRSAVDLLAVALTVAAAVVVLLTAGIPDRQQAGTIRWASAITAVLVLALHTWWRLESADTEQRRTLLWMALSTSVAALVSLVVQFVAPNVAGGLVVCAVCALVPPAVYAGAVRPDLVDVRGLVVRVLVAAAAITVYVALLATALALVELVTGRPPAGGVTLVVAALVALTTHPVQVVLRGVVDAVLFGRRPDPLRVASEVVGTIGDDPAAALAAVRDALVLPYAAVRVGGEVVAASGEAVTSVRALPLPLGDGGRGELVVGLRAGDLTLGAGDQHVLRLVAPLLAQTLRARAEAADVASSREAVIGAVEEERRRLRRDLHDGLGPVLSGMAFTTDAARNVLRADPGTADALLATLRTEATGAIAVIRQLVYGMRPPALDELGLLPALRQHAASLRTPDNRPLRVTFDADGVPALPAAWEVAAYRIVAAALDNAARHSGADTATARLAATGGSLVIEVIDSGTASVRDSWRPGVGLASMRERSAELGGTFSAECGPDGWQVRSVIPLPALGPRPLADETRRG